MSLLDVSNLFGRWLRISNWPDDLQFNHLAILF
jgi:hypothetical protein